MTHEVTPQEAIHALKTLSRLLEDTYGISAEEVLQESKTVPASIFASSLPPFSALATYLSQQGTSNKKIAQVTKRNRSFVRKTVQQAEFTERGARIPLNLFATELSVLEAAAHHLRTQGYEVREIATQLGKAQSTIRTVLLRAEEKRGGRL